MHSIAYSIIINKYIYICMYIYIYEIKTIQSRHGSTHTQIQHIAWTSQHRNAQCKKNAASQCTQTFNITSQYAMSTQLFLIAHITK